MGRDGLQICLERALEGEYHLEFNPVSSWQCYRECYSVDKQGCVSKFALVNHFRT